MAKFVSPELLKLVLPVVVSLAKELAAKTETVVDDRVVVALEAALANPVIFALLVSILTGTKDPVVPAPASVDELNAASVLESHSDTVKALFTLAA